MFCSVRRAVAAASFAVLFFAATPKWTAAQTGAAASSGDLKLTQSTNPDGSLESTWTTVDGTLVVKDIYRDNGDGTTTWNSDNYAADGKTIYSQTTYSTSADGSSGSNTVYADGRSVTITADSKGHITEMKETQPAAKAQTDSSQAAASEPSPAVPAPATEAPTNVSVTTRAGADGHLAIQVIYKPQAANAVGGSAPTIPAGSVNTAQSPNPRYLVFVLKPPPEVKAIDPGAVTTGPVNAVPVNSGTIPTFYQHSSGCIDVSKVMICNTLALFPFVNAANVSSFTNYTNENQATIWLPTFGPTPPNIPMHIDVSGWFITTTPSGSVIGDSPLNFNFNGNSGPNLGVTTGPNGQLQINVLPPSSSQAELDLRDFERRHFIEVLRKFGLTVPNNPAFATGPLAPSTPDTTTTPIIRITVPATGQYFNPTTGETGTFTPGQTLLGNWNLMPPVPAPPNLTPGSSVSFLPGQGPNLFVNKTTNKWEWGSWPYTPEKSAEYWATTFSRGWESTPETPVTTSPTTQTPAVRSSSTDYGSGSSIDQQTSATGVLVGEVVKDPQNTTRSEEILTYATFNGKQYRSGKSITYFDLNGHLISRYKWQYNQDGSPLTLSFIKFGQHGEPLSTQTTNFYTWGYDSTDSSISDDQPSQTFLEYKLTTPPGSTSPTTTPYTPPTLMNIGAICSRNVTAGGSYSCSLGPSSYTDNFKTVPILGVSDVSTLVAHLPDGSPFWPSLEVGVPGQGYFPVRTDGTFSFNLPIDWKPPLKLNLRFADTLPSESPTTAQLDFGNPVAAPTLPSSLFSPQTAKSLEQMKMSQLIALWVKADNIESTLADRSSAPSLRSFSIVDQDPSDNLPTEDLLSGVFSKIDQISSGIPPANLSSMARNLQTGASNYNSWLSKQPNLTADQQAELKSSTHWANFLSNEASNASRLPTGSSPTTPQPFWTNPILNQGKLNAIRGPLGDNLSGTQITIDNRPVPPLCTTPTEFYYMPPADLTPGEHKIVINSPFFPETTLPVFGMTLSMGAGQLNLHKGMTTNYFARLNISNGLPASLFTGPPVYETDIIGPSELSTIQQGAPTSRTGFISFSVTNQSPGTIAMKNEFRLLNASSFVPSGFNEIDGTITAKMDGSFSLLGVGRANLAPIGGIGPFPGTTPSTEGTSPSSRLPSFSLGSNPTLANNTTNCSAPAATTLAAGPTAVPGQTTPTTTIASSTSPTIPATTTTPTSTGSSTNPSTCGESPEEDLYKQATGNSTSVPVDNKTDSSAIDNAKKNVETARAKVNVAYSALNSAHWNRSDLWKAAFHHISKEDQDHYWNVFKHMFSAAADADAKSKAHAANPTAANLTALQSAQENAAGMKQWYANVRQNTINSFSPEDRAKWQAAEKAEEKAQQALDNARVQLIDAENTLGTLQSAASIK